MASVEPRLTRRGGREVKVWDARFRAPTGRQRKRTFDRKGDANRFAATVEADKLRGGYVDHTTRTAVTANARAWAAAPASAPAWGPPPPPRPSAARRVSSLIEVHIAGTRLGDRRLSAVRPSEVQGWGTDRARVLAPSTLRSLVGLLRSVYGAAVLDRLVASSPVVKVQLPRHERP